MKKNFGFVPKAEFSRRLNFLQSKIVDVLGKPLSSPKSELMPALYGVKVFKCKFDVLSQSHDFGITSEYENGFCAALSEVYNLIKDSELPF